MSPLPSQIRQEDGRRSLEKRGEIPEKPESEDYAQNDPQGRSVIKSHNQLPAERPGAGKYFLCCKQQCIQEQVRYSDDCQDIEMQGGHKIPVQKTMYGPLGSAARTFKSGKHEKRTFGPIDRISRIETGIQENCSCHSHGSCNTYYNDIPAPSAMPYIRHVK